MRNCLRAAIEISIPQLAAARQASRQFGKGSHPAGLNYGDCFSYALAKVSGEPLLCKGDCLSRTDIVPAIPA
jgi:ribonuclease VapC